MSDSVKLIVDAAGFGTVEVNGVSMQNHIESVEIHIKAGNRPIVLLGLNALANHIEIEGLVKLTSVSDKQRFEEFYEMPSKFNVFPFHLLSRLAVGDGGEMEDFAAYDQELVKEAFKWFAENWNA